MSVSRALFGGIEAGGTKFVCMVASGPEDIRAQIQFPTTMPEETIGKAVDFFQKQNAKHPLKAIGIGSFGPMDLNPQSPTFGFITSTPKQGWSNTDFAGTIRRVLGIPVVLDTDVNAAALGEQKWGAAQGMDTLVYLTIGTGIGGGGLINGSLMHGLVHPEMGHIRIPHDFQSDPFPGVCPFHGDCLEGLASGTSIQKRWCKPAEELPPEHQAWKLESAYLASGIANVICTLSPQRVIIGGGVMKQSGLLAAIRLKVSELLNSYIRAPEITDNIQNYITAPGLGDLSGVLGAIALASLYPTP